MIKAIYPGTFDPITNGHIDIVARAAGLFDHILLAVAESTAKKTMFDTDERVALAKEVLSDQDNIEVVSFHGLITKFADDHGATVIIRGLRAVSDFEYELQMATMNRQLVTNIETVFLTPDANRSFISSSLVREIASLNGDVSSFVPEPVLTALKNKLS